MICCVEAFGCQDQHGQLSAYMGCARASLAEDGERGTRSAHSSSLQGLKCGPGGNSALEVFLLEDHTTAACRTGGIKINVAFRGCCVCGCVCVLLKLVIDYIIMGPMQNLDLIKSIKN